MSIWSAIGLADRSAVENLVNQVESLKKENHRLLMDNQRLMSEQIRENYVGLCNAETQSTKFLADKIEEMYQALFAQMEGMSRLICQQLETDSEAARNSILSAEKKIETDVSAVNDSIRDLIRQQEKNMSEVRSSVSAVSAQMKEAKSCINETMVKYGDSLQKSGTQLSQQLNDSFSSMQQTQKKAEDAIVLTIEEQRRSLLSGIDRYCTVALEEVIDIAERYKQMECDEQESLGKIRTLSNEMLELGEHQKKVMEHLSQLCQDSDQFMEIQKSINDIWEIMKAVWVNSLLNDFDSRIDGALSDFGDENRVIRIKGGGSYNDGSTL